MARILVIDEGAINRRFVVTLLAGHGHRPCEASLGDEALRLAQTEAFDLVLVDVRALSAEWIALALNLRSAPNTPAPRLMLRAPVELEAEVRWLADAVDASFLAKPASPDTLLGAVQAALSVPSARQPEHLLQPAVKLIRDLTERAGQVAVARAALDLEVKKRLWAEQELTRANARLLEQATRDALTGLHNRRYLDESLEREENRARRSGRPLAIMMIDIDHFKRFNDTLGHGAGDGMLQAVARYLNSMARGEDIVARYGGDEFAIVMVQAALDTVRERALAIRSGALRLEIDYHGQRIGPVSLSVGIAVFPDHASSAHAALEAADGALIRSKRSGRGRVVMGDERER